jgi:hypothetical protein
MDSIAVAGAIPILRRVSKQATVVDMAILYGYDLML